MGEGGGTGVRRRGDGASIGIGSGTCNDVLEEVGESKS